MKILNTVTLILLTYISTGWQHKSYAEQVWSSNLDHVNIEMKPVVVDVWEFSYVIQTDGVTSGIHSGYFSYDDCKKAAMTLSNQHHASSYEVSDCYQVSKVVGIN